MINIETSHIDGSGGMRRAARRIATNRELKPMSDAKAKRRPPPLHLNGTPVRPYRETMSHGFSVRLTQAQYDGLQAVATGVHRWTGRHTSLQALIRTAADDFLRKNHAWTEMAPDKPEAAD
jgi:hypothetical protein